MKFKNIELFNMRESLKPVLNSKTILGYKAARNIRMISELLIEYDKVRNDAIIEYGQKQKDTNILYLKPGTENFKQFMEFMKPYDNVIQDTNLIMAKYEDTIGELTGEQILNICWMLED